MGKILSIVLGLRRWADGSRSSSFSSSSSSGGITLLVVLVEDAFFGRRTLFHCHALELQRLGVSDDTGDD
jgi:hypothetical protein